MSRLSQKEWPVKYQYFGLHWPLRLIFYFSRCTQSGARDPALYIPARHCVCCMMEGGGCSGPARLILSQGTRRVNSRQRCCLGLPDFPRENIQRGYRRMRGERHAGLFIEQVRRRGEERPRASDETRRGESVISAADSVRGDLGWRLQHLLSTTELPTFFLVCLAGAKANRLCLMLLTYGREGSHRGELCWSESAQAREESQGDGDILSIQTRHAASRSLWCFSTSAVLTLPSSLINKITFIPYLFSHSGCSFHRPPRCQLASAPVQRCTVCLYFTLTPFNHFHHFSELTFYIKSSYHPWLMLNDEWW